MAFVTQEALLVLRVVRTVRKTALAVLAAWNRNSYQIGGIYGLTARSSPSVTLRSYADSQTEANTAAAPAKI